MWSSQSLKASKFIISDREPDPPKARTVCHCEVCVKNDTVKGYGPGYLQTLFFKRLLSGHPFRVFAPSVSSGRMSPQVFCACRNLTHHPSSTQDSILQLLAPWSFHRGYYIRARFWFIVSPVWVFIMLLCTLCLRFIMWCLYLWPPHLTRALESCQSPANQHFQASPLSRTVENTKI